MGQALEQQRASKRGLLSRALAARELAAEADELVWEGSGLGYRNRIRLRVEPTGSVCFFNPQKVETCAVLEPGLQLELARVLQLSRRKPELFSGFRHLELRSADLDGRLGLALAAGDGPAQPAPLARELERDGGRWQVGVIGDEAIPCQRRSPDGHVHAEVPLDAFWQINSQVNHRLVEGVCGALRARDARRVQDLFAGAGNFSLPLAARGAAITAVELRASAVKALQRSARTQALAVQAQCAAAELACQRLLEAGARFDAVIVDGPRAGAERVMAQLAALAPSAIVICSCNPDTLARDLALITARGYRLERLSAFDMFPHTRHVESLAVLARARSR